MAEQALGPMAGIILFAVSAAIILLFIFTSLSGIQGSFESTICKFNAWMRASTLGNPLFESLLSTTSFMAGGFGGTAVSSITIPLVCKTSPELPPKDEPYTLSEVVRKISEEAVNCWDQFGLGKWDPLVMSPQGQTFTCFEQVLELECDQQDMLKLWDEQTTDVESAVLQSCSGGPCEFGTNLFQKYLEEHYYNYGDFEKTYANILPAGAPVIGTENEAGPFRCDGTEITYYVGLYYVDAFRVLSGTAMVPLICKTLTGDDLTHDSLYLCIIEY